jgi:hypothetical protein
MAGRPIRRAREVARQNPLVGYIKNTNLTSKDVWEPYAPLLLAKAEEKYAKAYGKVVPNIIVYFGNVYSEDLIAMAKKQNAIVLNVGEKLRYSGTFPFYRHASEQRGQPSRVAPFTPFVLLHRLGDKLQTGWHGSPAIHEALEIAGVLWNDHVILLTGKPPTTPEKIARRAEMLQAGPLLENMIAGVDTAAGRMGVLQDTSQMASDLFAKYLLTGKIAYSPPTSKSTAWNEYYETMREALTRAVHAMVDHVKPGQVYRLG